MGGRLLVLTEVEVEGALEVEVEVGKPNISVPRGRLPSLACIED